MTRILPFACLAFVFVAACGNDGNRSPSEPSSATPTRIINLSGSLNFEQVEVGSSRDRSFTIANTGNSPLTFTGLSVPSGSVSSFGGSPLSGTVPAGGSVNVLVRFTPASAQVFQGNIIVNADHTSGTNTIPFVGTGVDNTALFVFAGAGNTVFDMPTKIRRIRIQATYSQSSSNFIVKIAGSLVVNELLGTFWGQTSYDGTHAIAGGGQVEITNSSGVQWIFTEVR